MPPRNKCNLNNIIYQANISTKENDTNKKVYIGMTNIGFKHCNLILIHFNINQLFAYSKIVSIIANNYLIHRWDLNSYYHFGLECVREK